MNNKIIIAIISTLVLIILIMAYFLGSNKMMSSVEINKEENVRVVTATGVDANYDWALMKAIENAVKQSSPIYVNRTAPYQKTEVDVLGSSFKANLDAINATFEGKIDSYEVISSKKSMGGYYVTIKAKIILPKQVTIQEYTSPDLAKGEKPTVAVVDFTGPRSFTCGGAVTSLNAINNVLGDDINQKLLETRKFKMLSRDTFSQYKDEIALIAKGLTKDVEKSRLKNILSADYILTGKVVNLSTTDLTKSFDMLGESYSKTRYSIAINYKLIETATMQIVSTGKASYVFTQEAAAQPCYNMLSTMAAKLANKVSDKVMFDLFPAVPAEKDEAKQVVKQVETVVKNVVIEQPQAEQQRQVVKLPFDK